MRKKQMNKGKRIVTWLLALGLLLGCIIMPDTEAYADNLILALSASTVKIGDSLTVTVTLPAGVTGTVNLTYSQELFQYTSASATATSNAGTVSMTLGSYTAGNTRASGTVTFKATAAGNGSFAVSAPNAGNQEGDRVSVGDAGATVSVENAANEEDATKSPDNSLQSLSLSSGTLSPAFAYNVTNYTAEVENDVTLVSVSAKTSNAAATIESVTGGENLSVGENTIKIVVKAENGVSATYTITVTRKAGASDDAETIVSEPEAGEEGTEADEPQIPAAGEEVQEETQEESALAVQALNAQIQDLQSQNRMLLWAFVIVTLILVVIIVALVVKQRRIGVGPAEQEPVEEPAEEPEEETEEATDEETEAEPEENPAGETTITEEEESAVEDALAEAIIAQAQAATGVLRVEPPEPEKPLPEPEKPEPGSETDEDDIEFIDL